MQGRPQGGPLKKGKGTMAYKAVFFDLDGTVYNYNRGDRLGKEAISSYMEREFGLSGEETGRALKWAFLEAGNRIGYSCGALHNRLIRYQMMLEHLSLPIHPHAMALASLYWDTLIGQAQPEPGLIPLLQALRSRGLITGFGTNMTAMIQFKKLDRLGLWPYTDVLVTSEEVGTEKPDRRVFDWCARKASLSNEECIFIGDTWAHDVDGARKAGMEGILYQGKESDPVPFEERILSFENCLTGDGIRLGKILLP